MTPRRRRGDGANEPRRAEEPRELIEGLEPGQLVAVTSRPLALRAMSVKLRIGLWILRIAVLVLTGLVVYVFVRGV